MRNPTLDPQYSLPHKARHFKAEVSKCAAILQHEFDNPSIVSEIPAPHSAFMPTNYNFCHLKVAFRYCLYWATTIIANSILTRLGDTDSSLVQECQSAADKICRSIHYFRHFKPLGVMFMTFVMPTAFGVSSNERREQIVQEIQDLFEILPIKIGRFTMQYTFDVLTGALVKQM